MKASIRIAFTALIVMSAAVFANAQTVEKKTLTIDGAKKVIAGAVAYAKKNNAPGGVIAVVDEGGNLMALERLDGTFAAGANISIGKARTAVLFKRPTKAFEDIIKNGRTAMVALPDAFFTPLQGGVPIMVDGQIVGGVGVSGAASAQQDEEFALAGANVLSEAKMSGMSQANKPEALFFDATQVSTSFSAGAVLLDGNDHNYMVHTSRRDKPGLAEIHTLDTDSIYEMDGRSKFEPGGTVPDAQDVEPDELRCPRIEGGVTRHLTKGKVIIVPNNTPHWFKKANREFLYPTIKVRQGSLEFNADANAT